MMRRLDRELGLPSDAAKRVKERLEKLEAENRRLSRENEELKQKMAALESENQTLRNRVSSLESENEALKRKMAEIVGGGLGVRRISDERGERIEFALSTQSIAQLTSNGVLKPIEPNTLKIGDDESYLNDVVTANLTVASHPKNKKNIREPDPSLRDLRLPTPKIYERAEGRGETELGFIAEELPKPLRRRGGYDLKALVALLAWKVNRLEEAVRNWGFAFERRGVEPRDRKLPRTPAKSD